MRGFASTLTFIAISFLGASFSFAQDSSTPSESDVESLYDQIDQQSDQASKKEAEAAPKAQIDHSDSAGPAPKLPEAQTITELNQLQPFSDIAVIQRRFLPKTKRFEFSAIGLTNLNNPFFNNFGGSAKVAYYLTEQYAIEGIATGLAIASRQVTEDLRGPPAGITTTNSVTARSFFGAALKWNPIYGKVSFLNKAIVPFDLNFSLGGGVTGTDIGRSEPTVHFGTSQIFALSKSFGVRWDIDWNFYQATFIDSNNQQSKIFHNDLYIGIGVSFYFPGAKYR